MKLNKNMRMNYAMVSLEHQDLLRKNQFRNLGLTIQKEWKITEEVTPKKEYKMIKMEK